MGGDDLGVLISGADGKEFLVDFDAVWDSHVSLLSLPDGPGGVWEEVVATFSAHEVHGFLWVVLAIVSDEESLAVCFQEIEEAWFGGHVLCQEWGDGGEVCLNGFEGLQDMEEDPTILPVSDFRANAVADDFVAVDMQVIGDDGNIGEACPEVKGIEVVRMAMSEEKMLQF